MIIYKTVNKVNGHYYIGKDQKNNPDYLGSGLALKRAIIKYGKDQFDKEILESCNNASELANREKYWIAQYNAVNDPNSYNIHEGGYGGNTGAYHKVGRSGPANAMFGKKRTPEQKLQQSMISKQYFKNESPEKRKARLYKNKMSQIGKPKNPISIAKMTATRRKQCQETIITLSQYTLISPNNEIYVFDGKKALAQWCKLTNRSVWTIERRLLTGVSPKSGNLIGWSATVKFVPTKNSLQKLGNT